MTNGLLHNPNMYEGQSRVARELIAIGLKIIVLFVAVLMVAQAAQAAPLVLNADTGATHIDPSIEFLLDPTGQLNLAQIDTQSDLQFAPIDRSKPYLLGNGVLWMRFDIVINNPTPQWRLTLPMPPLDEVSMYYRNPAGQWVTQQAGDNRPMSTWALRGRYPAFSLSTELGQTVRYYVQVRHTRIPYSILPRIVSDAQFISSRQNEHLLMGIYFGLTALVVVLALANALTYRDWGFGSYAVYTGLFAVVQASIGGMAALYLWPEMPVLNNSATLTLGLLTVAAGIWFVRTVTLPRRFSKALDATMLLMMGLLIVVSVLNAALPNATSFMLYNLVLITSMLVLFAAVAVALMDGDRHARWLALGLLPVVLGTTFPLLRNVGLVTSGFLTDYGLMLGSALEVPILYYGLHHRLAQGRSISERASGLRYADPLTGVNTAKVMRLKLKQLLGATPRLHQPFAFLAIDLENYAALQNKYNRDTADRALIMAAARIRSVARSVDTVARMGDTLFGVLIEGSGSASDANAVATKILAAGLRATNELPEREPLRFNIVVGYSGESNVPYPVQADTVMAQLLAALQKMKADSGKAIRLLKL